MPNAFHAHSLYVCNMKAGGEVLINQVFNHYLCVWKHCVQKCKLKWDTAMLKTFISDLKASCVSPHTHVVWASQQDLHL